MTDEEMLALEAKARHQFHRAERFHAAAGEAIVLAKGHLTELASAVKARLGVIETDSGGDDKSPQ